MTNKVKPFFIRITDDMTPQVVQDAFDKCVDAGATACECVTATTNKHPYSRGYGLGMHKLFGVRDSGSTRLYQCRHHFGQGAQEITLDQLDEWLGLKSEQEWKDGDECIKDGEKYIYIAKHPTKDGRSICVHVGNSLTYTLVTGKLRKPETPEQKAERERMESGRELWLKHQQALAYVKILPSGKDKAWDSDMLSKDEMESWCILAENVTWIK